MKAWHSRINCSRSFTRVIDSSGSFDPRARARKDATSVENPPNIQRNIKKGVYDTGKPTHPGQLSILGPVNLLEIRKRSQLIDKLTLFPLTTTAKPVVRVPNRTWSPIAALRAYPVIFALKAYLSLSVMAVRRVGSRRSPTVLSRAACQNRFEQRLHMSSEHSAHLFEILLPRDNPIKFILQSYRCCSSGAQWPPSRIRMYSLTSDWSDILGYWRQRMG